MSDWLLWPQYSSPSDLAAIEAIPLAERNLPDSTYAIVCRAASRWPDRIATSVLSDGAHWQHPDRRTFGRLRAQVTRTANLLYSMGIRRKDAVVLLSPNCESLITATLAAQVAGIAAPINPALAPEHIRSLVERLDARVIIASDTEPGCDARARALLDAGVVDTVIALSVLDELSVDCDEEAFAGGEPTGDDIATIFHTGGTTGLPKLAAHTHTNEVANAWMISAMTLLDDDSVIFAALPLFHVNAMMVTVLAPLLRGQQTVWAGPLGYRDPELLANFWNIVECYGVNAMSAVPTVYAALAQIPVDADLSSLRFAVVGASALPAAVREAFESRTGVPLVEGYGLTEATAASARSFPEHPRPGSVGQRMPYQRLRVIRTAGDGKWHDCAPGETGRLAIGGPTVFPGYVVDRNSNGFVLDGKGMLVDGWLDTGDLARVDDEGFIYLTGRAKDLIIRGGHNIDPIGIEDSLLSHPAVTAAAAVGRPDPHAGEVPVAYVTVTGAPTEAELLEWSAQRVSERAAAPKSVTVIESLPVTAVGKPNKLPLRADAARLEISDALAGIDGVIAVDCDADDGTVRATIRTRADFDVDAIQKTMSRYTIDYRITATDRAAADPQ
jgi:fatty-acyl-CoA synthase